MIPPITNLNDLFYLILDEDKAGLNRREQLVLALSIIHMKKSRLLHDSRRYQSILQPHSQKYLKRPKSKSDSPGATRKKFF
ncbi:MAG: hypothetical protein DLM72_18550 [Candidatus Nitrosopolaris wilkensis]|nr:MAG: hypothetical protein DLM72_18550 [Candidatus Nitrosopolaris wilkensis]